MGKADLVEEALELIQQGQLDLAEGATRYGHQWVELYPLVETALRINQASQPPVVSERAFVPFDKAAGWQALKTQLVANPPAPAARPVRRTVTAKPTFNFNQWLANLWGPRLRKVGAMALIALVMFIVAAYGINSALPGDVLYQSKLGLDHVGELASFNPNDQANAALNYSNRRLSEIEALAQNGRPEQLTEAQNGYERGLQLSIYYSNDAKFTNYLDMYDQLNAQKSRVARLAQLNFMQGQHSVIQANYILNQLDTGVYNMAPKIPGRTSLGLATSADSHRTANATIKIVFI